MIDGEVFPTYPESVHPKVDMPDPTPEMLNGDPLFDAIWGVIKSWDVKVRGAYNGYCGANGSHARLIYDAVKKTGAA